MATNKLNNKKITYKGIIFDSKMELDYYIEVILKNDYTHELKPKFVLLPAFTNNQGKQIRAITYTADFLVYIDDICYVVEVKGMATNEFKLKRKLFEYNYPNHNYLILVKYQGEFINWDDNEKRKRKNKLNKQ